MSSDGPDSNAYKPSEISGIAKYVLGISGGGIVTLAIVTIIASRGNGKVGETSQMVFNSLLPLLGTWVGTVLAYYFSKSNFESASKSVERMVTLTTEQKLGQMVVQNEMMRPAQITAFRMLSGKVEKDVLLKDLRRMLGGKITRVPILDPNGVVLYIIHQSGLFRFLADESLKATAPNLSTLTLQDMIADAELKNWVSNIAYVPESATVADAKKLMEQQRGCQDLIVTKSGSKTEPMSGWMTNVDIGRLSRA